MQGGEEDSLSAQAPIRLRGRGEASGPAFRSVTCYQAHTAAAARPQPVPADSRVASFPDTSRLESSLATEGDPLVRGSFGLPENSFSCVCATLSVAWQFFLPSSGLKHREFHTAASGALPASFILKIPSPGLLTSSVSPLGSLQSPEALSSPLRLDPTVLVGSQNWGQWLEGLDR